MEHHHKLIIPQTFIMKKSFTVIVVFFCLLTANSNGHFTEDCHVTRNNVAERFSFLLWQTGRTGFTFNGKLPY
jgi:hypothetical protein